MALYRSGGGGGAAKPVALASGATAQNNTASFTSAYSTDSFVVICSEARINSIEITVGGVNVLTSPYVTQDGRAYTINYPINQGDTCTIKPKGGGTTYWGFVGAINN